MNDTNVEKTQSSYDQVAAIYAEQFQNELDFKPFDRKMLDWLAERVDSLGTICDMGCGPGQIAAYLSQQTSDVCGIDLSSEMILEAQKLYPHIRFQQGNMLNLNGIDDGAFGGMSIFYSLIHVPYEQHSTVLGEFYRVVKSGGTILLTFHIGEEIRHLDEWFDKEVDIDFRFFETDKIRTELEEAGFTVTECLERHPYAKEVQTKRAYLFAEK